MLEALACSVPVAAFAVPGPLDVLQQGVTGVMHEDLGEACRQALALDRQACAGAGRGAVLAVSAEEFLALQASGPGLRRNGATNCRRRSTNSEDDLVA